MPDTLGTDNNVVSEHLDFTPNDRAGLRRKTAKIDQLSFLCHFSEGSTISLADDDELAALVGPTPRAGAFAIIAP